MLKNHLTLALRNLKKYKGYSFINIFGLSVGMAVCLIIVLFVINELSYDRFNKKSDRIFRVCLDAAIGEIASNTASASAPLAETLKREIPDVETVVRFRKYGFPVFKYQTKVFSEESIIWADATLFDVFTIPFLKGNPGTALTKPNGLVITETTAKRYFGDEEPIGKTINSDNSFDYIVTGVVKNMPKNSHFHFDFVAALSRFDDSKNPIWFYNNFQTYVVLKKGASWKDVDGRLNAALMKFIKPQIEQAFQTTWEQLVKTGARYKYYLQPLTDIHLKSHIENEFEPNGSISNVYVFSFIAFAILCIACFNFVNLSTARYSSRAKEVGIRKTIGSNRGQLVRQFLSESIIMSFIAVIISIFLVYLLLPAFNNIADKEIVFNLFNNYYLLPSILLLIVAVGVAAGIYPAFFLASFNPITVLGGSLKTGAKGKNLRGSLVILQFTVTAILIVGTIIVFNQLDLLQNKNLGYKKEQLLVIRKTDDIGNRIFAFKDILRKNLLIKSVSNSSRLPGMPFSDNLYESGPAGHTHKQLFRTVLADYDFLNTFEMKMAQGRYYSQDWVADAEKSIVINETAARVFGLADPVGSEISEVGLGGERSRVWKIIGVVKDFNFESLHQPVRPLAILLLGKNQFAGYVSVRLATDNIRRSIESIENIWAEFAGKQPFEYTFFNEDYARLYKSEEKTSKLFAAFSLLAILIGCLGLFGLAAFTAEKKTKEIGIRKVLGASIQSILFLLSREFIKWLLIANAIAFPIAYYFMNQWLQAFAYRVDIRLSTFIMAGTATFIIALFAVSFQSVKAAIGNPVKSLKYE